MRDPPVILEPYAFSSLMMSAIEIHDRESMGLLIGQKDRQFVQGKVKRCIAIQASYPIQTAYRKRSTVGYGNFAASILRRERRDRLENGGQSLLRDY